MARAKKSAAAAPESEAPPEINWAYGIRTWASDGKSYGDFQWDLTPEARTTAPDWSPRPECGQGLHCNPYGMGDWSLLGNLNDVAAGNLVLGIVRYDAALAVDLNGKIKAPWMEVVITTRTAGMGSVLGYLAKPRHDLVFSSAKATDEAAATTGYGSAAATTGKHSIAAALGPNGTAKAGIDGAIMLAAYGEWDGAAYPLIAVFAGMVGQTYGDFTIEPGVAYALNIDGSLRVAS